MAVSSANRSGRPPATTCDEAVEQLGEAVAVYLDGGPSGEPVPSTIVDVTGDGAARAAAGRGRAPRRLRVRSPPTWWPSRTVTGHERAR